MKTLLLVCCLVSLSWAVRYKRQGFIYGWPPPSPLPPPPPVLVEQCRTPDGKPGGCIHWMDCPTLQKLMECPSAEAYVFIRRSSCGVYGFDPIVCCPSEVPYVDHSGGPCRPQKPTSRPLITTSGPSPVGGSILPTQCGNSSVIRDRVVGGTEAPPGAWPWMAQLIYQNKGRKAFGCAGTLITDQHVLTAAHCFKSGRTPIAVRLGEHGLGTGGSEVQEVAVEGATAHENYQIYSSGHDIGIIKLQRKVTFTGKVQPICLASGSAQDEDLSGNKAVVAGWGAIKEDGAVSSVLREARLPIIALPKCQQSYSDIPGSRIDDSVLCAGNLSGGLDSCQGDSGGPLMLKREDGRYQQVGIVSWGRGCARAGYPGVYSKVTYYLDWIVSKLT